MTYHINIGSNQGSRTDNIDRAVALLSALGSVVAVSSPVRSMPWGYQSDSEFVNLGVNLESELDPHALLCGLKSIERQIAPGGEHRDADGRYADREIDLDLIAAGSRTVDLPDLKVPHPLMSRRAFVLEPMMSLMPDWRHPQTGLSCEEMLAAL